MECCQVGFKKICNVRLRKNKIQFSKNRHKSNNLKHRIHLRFEEYEKQNESTACIQQKHFQSLSFDVAHRNNSSQEQKTTDLIIEDEIEVSNKQELQWENLPIQMGSEIAAPQLTDNEQDQTSVCDRVVQIDLQNYQNQHEDDRVNEEDLNQSQNTSKIDKVNIQKEDIQNQFKHEGNTFQNNILDELQIENNVQTNCIEHQAIESKKNELTVAESQKIYQDSVQEEDFNLCSDQSSNTGINIRIGHVESRESSFLSESSVSAKLQNFIETRDDQKLCLTKRFGKWEKIMEKNICMTYNKYRIQLKGLLYQLVQLEHFDAIIQIWRIYENKKNSSSKHISSLGQLPTQSRNEKNNLMIEPIGQIKIKGLSTQVRDLVKENLQILIGFYLKVNKRGKISINSNQNAEQILSMIQ